jgi:hypothetical protein
MKHRHLNHEGFTATAIDDIIPRGVMEDWALMKFKAHQNAEIRFIIKQICEHYIKDAYAQRYHFWYNYVKFIEENT